MAGFGKFLEGFGLVVAGAILAPIAPPLAPMLISAGAGMALSGLGTMLAGPGTGRDGTTTGSRNPIKPWDVILGQTRVGGTLVYVNFWPPPAGYSPSGPWWSPFGLLPQQFTAPNAFLDLVYVLAAHPCQSVDAVLFEGTPIAIDPTALAGAGAGKPSPTLGGTSYTPTQTHKQTTSISRSNGVVTVTCPFDIPSLNAGYPVVLIDAPGADGLSANGLAGTYIVAQIVSRNPGVSLVFTVLGGGKDVTVPGGSYGTAGYVSTGWPNYGRDVYVEYMLGDQLLGQTFEGMVSGTPFRGTGTFAGPNYATNTPSIPADGVNPWNTYCSLQGKTAVFIRLYYEQQYFQSGLPQISFLVHGKRDIYDPRLGALTGINTVTLSTGGGGWYAMNDVITVTGGGGSGGQITIATVSSTGDPVSWAVTATGYGYSIGGPYSTSGGTGSGAQFNITVLGGISSGINTVSISAAGQHYNDGDILLVNSPGGSCGYVKVWTTTSGGGVISVVPISYNGTTHTALTPFGGYWYSTAGGPWPTTLVSSLHNVFTGLNAAVGSGTGCLIGILTVTNGNTPSSGGYTTNSALVVADYLANTIWGYGASYVSESGTRSPFNAIGTAALIISADVCDQQVLLAEGQSLSPPGPAQYESMYSCNGRFELSQPRGDVLQNLLTSCAGRLLYVGGVYSIQPGYWTPAGFPSGSPAVAPVSATALNLEQIAVGPPVWRPNIKIRELFNAVKGTYINPGNRWQSSDFPYYAQDSLHGYAGPLEYGGDINLAVDLGQRRYKDIHFPFTISASMAQRLAKIELLRGRNQGGYGLGTGTFSCNMAGWQCIPLDVLSANFTPVLGWSGKYLEVTAVRFRVQKQGDGDAVTLSTELDVQETSDTIYAWSYYEQLSSAGYQQAFSPPSSANETVPFPWSPGGVAPLTGDAIYIAGTAGQGNFDVLPAYGADAQGNATANLQITGVPPLNQLDTSLIGPFVSAYASPSGGSLAPGTYAVGVSAFDASGNNLAYLDLATVVMGGGQGAASCSVSNAGTGYFGSTVNLVLQGGGNNCVVAVTVSGGSVTGISSIVNPGNGYSVGNYPANGGSGTGCVITIGTLTGATATGSINLYIPEWGAGNNGGEVYMALLTASSPQMQGLTALGETLAADQMHYQQTLSAGQATATITSFDASTAGGPDTLFDHFGVVWQEVVHTGPWAEQIQAVTGTSGTSPGTITIFGSGMTANQWAGHTLTLLAHYDPTIPIQILNMPIASSTASSGGMFTLTIGRNSASGQLPSLTSLLSVADLVTVRYNPTFTVSSFTDPNIANGFYPSGDLATEAGHLVVVMTGVDAGDVQTVASVSGVSNDTINIQGTWQATPNTGDVVIIVEPASVPEWKSKSIQTSNRSSGAIVVGTPTVQNLLEQVWLFAVKTEDVKGNSAPLFVAPSREVYFFGAQGSRLITYVAGSPSTTAYTMLTYDGQIEADCTGGSLTLAMCPLSSVPNQTFTVTKIDSSANTITLNMYSGDTLVTGAASWVGTTKGASITFRSNG